MRIPAWMPAALVATATFATVLFEAASPRPGAGMVAFWTPVAADLPTAAAIADAVGGRIARAGGFSGWWIVAAKPAAGSADLYRAGAWLVVDAKFLQACSRLTGGST